MMWLACLAVPRLEAHQPLTVTDHAHHLPEQNLSWNLRTSSLT